MHTTFLFKIQCCLIFLVNGCILLVLLTMSWIIHLTYSAQLWPHRNGTCILLFIEFMHVIVWNVWLFKAKMKIWIWLNYTMKKKNVSLSSKEAYENIMWPLPSYQSFQKAFPLFSVNDWNIWLTQKFTNLFENN